MVNKVKNLNTFGTTTFLCATVCNELEVCHTYTTTVHILFLWGHLYTAVYVDLSICYLFWKFINIYEVTDILGKTH